MKQITTNAGSLKQIARLCHPVLIASVVRLLWQLVAAVRSFFRQRSLATFDGSV